MLVPYVLRIVYNYKGILFYNYFITIDVSVFLETAFQFPSDVNNKDRDSRKKKSYEHITLNISIDKKCGYYL